MKFTNLERKSNRTVAAPKTSNKEEKVTKNDFTLSEDGKLYYDGLITDGESIGSLSNQNSAIVDVKALWNSTERGSITHKNILSVFNFHLCKGSTVGKNSRVEYEALDNCLSEIDGQNIKTVFVGVDTITKMFDSFRGVIATEDNMEQILIDLNDVYRFYTEVTIDSAKTAITLASLELEKTIKFIKPFIISNKQNIRGQKTLDIKLDWEEKTANIVTAGENLKDNETEIVMTRKFNKEVPTLYTNSVMNETRAGYMDEARKVIEKPEMEILSKDRILPEEMGADLLRGLKEYEDHEYVLNTFSKFAQDALRKYTSVTSQVTSQEDEYIVDSAKETYKAHREVIENQFRHFAESFDLDSEGTGRIINLASLYSNSEYKNMKTPEDVQFSNKLAYNNCAEESSKYKLQYMGDLLEVDFVGTEIIVGVNKVNEYDVLNFVDGVAITEDGETVIACPEKELLTGTFTIRVLRDKKYASKGLIESLDEIIDEKPEVRDTNLFELTGIEREAKDSVELTQKRKAVAAISNSMCLNPVFTFKYDRKINRDNFKVDVFKVLNASGTLMGKIYIPKGAFVGLKEFKAEIEDIMDLTWKEFSDKHEQEVQKGRILLHVEVLEDSIVFEGDEVKTKSKAAKNTEEKATDDKNDSGFTKKASSSLIGASSSSSMFVDDKSEDKVEEVEKDNGEKPKVKRIVNPFMKNKSNDNKDQVDSNQENKEQDSSTKNNKEQEKDNQVPQKLSFTGKSRNNSVIG